MTAFVKKVTAIIMITLVLLQGSAAFAAHDDFMPEDILAKRAESRFDSNMDKNDDFDPYACDLIGLVIGIDPGHQLHADAQQEPVYPDDNSKTKDRTSPGAVGVRSGVAEYEVNLAVSLKLAEYLKAAGATVVMSRSTNDVNISNMERAKLMNEAGVDFWLRIHCNSSLYQRTHGALIIAPDKGRDIHESSVALGKQVLAGFCAATGAECRGVSYTSTQTGVNWSDVPVVTIEMGYLSNPREDVLLGRESYRNTCAAGIFAGIAAYCAEEEEA